MKLSIPDIIDGDWQSIRIALQKLTSLRLGSEATPTWESIKLLGLTASRLVWTDATNTLASKDLIDLVAGISGIISVADDGDGSITLNLSDLTDPGADRIPFWDETNNKITWASVIGSGLTLSGTDLYWAWLNMQDLSESPNEGSIMVYKGASGGVEWKDSSDLLDEIGLGAGDSPEFTGLTLSGLTASRMVASDAGKALVSSDLAGWVAGVANEIDITDDGDGTITIGIVDPLIVGKGGSGAATFTDHSILVGSGTDAFTAIGAATNGQLPIGSTGADPVLATLTGTANEVDITNAAGSITIGIVDPLIVGKGGSGAATFTDHSILLGSGTDPFTALGAATNGQLPIGSTGNDPVLAELTGTANQITVTNGAGSITLSTPQNIHTGASPTFAGLDLTGITDGVLPYVAAGGFADSTVHTDGSKICIGGTLYEELLDIYSASADPIEQIVTSGDYFPRFKLERRNAVAKTNRKWEWSINSSGWLIYKDATADNDIMQIGAGAQEGSLYINSTGVQISPGGAGTDTPVTIFNVSQTAPYITLRNTSAEDGDGSRESRIIARGKQSGGEVTVLGYMEFAHDGAADDEKGLWRILLNDGDDAAAPSITGIEIDSAGIIDLVANPIIKASSKRIIEINDTNGGTFFGTESFNNDRGEYNIGIGYRTGYNVDSSVVGTGDDNIFIGYEAGHGGAGSTMDRNVAIGYQALKAGTSAVRNFALGWRTLYSNVTGDNNIAIGISALQNGTDIDDNIAIGYSAGLAITGDYSVLIGSSAGVAMTSGDRTVAVGYGAIGRNVTGRYITAIGYQAAAGSVAANSFSGGTHIGYRSGFDVTTGSYNVSVGYYSLYNILAGGYNTSLGTESGFLLETGTNNVFLGYKAGYNQTANSNLLIIDNQDRGAVATEITNSLIYGVFNAAPASQSLRFNATAIINSVLKLLERSSDPTEPAEGECVIWMSDGTGKGDDGDVMIASQAGGATKYGTLFDHSGGAAW